MVFDLREPQELTAFVLQGDNNDLFHIEGSTDGSAWIPLWTTPIVQRPGLQLQEESVHTPPIRFIKLRATGGDDFVSVSEVAAYCQRPEDWRSTFTTVVGNPRLAPVELREGAGATAWLWLWGALLFTATVLTTVLNLRRTPRPCSTWLPELRQHLKQTYLTLDHRTLGLFRIALGLLLFCDLHYWIQSFDLVLSSKGLLASRELILGTDPLSSFTLLRWNSADWITWAFITVSFLAYAAFMAGYRTRAAQILTWACAISLHNAVPLLNNSGHMVMRIVLTWTLLLPLGERFSMDAVLRTKSGKSAPSNSFTSALALILPLQLSAIYFFNVLHKFDDTWLNGSFLSIIMQDPSITTAVGLHVVEWLPMWIVSAGTLLTLAVEAAAPFLLLSPIWPKHCRTVAVSALFILHLGIALCMKLAIFSGAMICFLILMLPGRVGEKIIGWLARPFRRELSDQVASKSQIDTPGETPAWTRAGKALVTTLFLTLFGAASVSQLIRENEPLSLWFPHRPIPPLQRILTTLNTYQGWCMFATCGNRSFPAVFETLVVEAIDVHGHRIDLLRSIFADREIAPPADLNSPPIEAHNEQWRLYNRRVTEQNPAILTGLADYLHNFPYTRFNLTPPIRIEAYARHQPVFSPAKGYPPLVIRRDVAQLSRLIAPSP